MLFVILTFFALGLLLLYIAYTGKTLAETLQDLKRGQ